ncbi:MAG TPA: hypothetical protein VGH89_32805, partial [Pseudonocardia sp.]
RNNEQTRNYWFRLFATRDVALAAWVLGTPENSAQRKFALRTGIAVDSMDAAAWLLAARRRELPALGALALAGLHVAAIGLGAVALATDESTFPSPG